MIAIRTQRSSNNRRITFFFFIPSNNTGNSGDNHAGRQPRLQVVNVILGGELYDLISRTSCGSLGDIVDNSDCAVCDSRRRRLVIAKIVNPSAAL